MSLTHVSIDQERIPTREGYLNNRLLKELIQMLWEILHQALIFTALYLGVVRIMPLTHEAPRAYYCSKFIVIYLYE